MNRKASLTALINRQGLSIYLLAAGCLLLGPWNADALQMFSLDRSDLAAGEFWRFWTGPLVHLSWAHIGLNVAGLILLQQMFGQELRPVISAWGYGIIALLVGLCFMAFSRFGYVVGLSAVLHGLFAMAACLAMRRDGLLSAGVLLVIGGKVVWEKIQGPSTLVEDLIGLPVAADTHLYGFGAGLVLGTVIALSAVRR
ncbi:MAG: rhombosortase [Gammaproteobacteria bacterium]|jgi:rhomboid family GlyGly-CTERM serine protease|nr:rhombosortase [Gammaproteobacteria bacterium]MDP6617043.1 rhombosortase [Gammaproteobacteria bacterium]MDP6695065.1 rhombosortase [Gammaproteobacteria bacterium]